ncbi:extracellular solute-binding protein [Brevibacillus sp. B_LB10_24]|uniref:extracellular solute-binding protein n=1 Tax=Brevibacillus sp. B_LB10_24 TaxID=3380645 RepID=UPI0038BBF3DA
MKRFVSTLLVFSVAALAGCGVPAPSEPGKEQKSSGGAAREITVAGNGGVIEKTIRDEIGPKFTEKTGIKVNYLAGLSGEILSKVELQKNAPQIDLTLYVPLDVQRASQKGLAETLDDTIIPNISQVDDRYTAFEKVGVPVFGYVIAPAYNTKSFEANGIAPIASWNDLIRPEYKGKTAYADITNDNGFTILYNLATANGGSLDDMEPGIAKAKELAAYSDTFYKNSTQIRPALQQGAADVTVMSSADIAQVAVSGVPLKLVIPKEGAPMQAMNATVVKNTPRKSEAEEFLNYLLSEEAQLQVAESGFYSVLKGAKVPEKYASVTSLNESDPLFKPDFAKLSEIRAAMTDRWAKEVTPELGKKVKP